jgi:hypothetical protein
LGDLKASGRCDEALISRRVIRMSTKLPAGSAPSSPGARPRAQVSYEGEDEFSAMSLDPKRREALKEKQQIAPPPVGEKPKVKVDELKSTNDQGVVGLFRKIFAK